MKLTSAQIDYLNSRRKQVNEIIESKPKYGILSYHTERQILNLFAKLHNIAVKESKS